MPVLPNTGVTTPTVGGSSGTWGTENNAAWANYDAHDHASGNGKRINSDAILVDAALTFGGYQATNLGGVAFTPVAALAAGLYVIFVDTATGDLYWRTSAGVNVRLTNGASLNVSAFVGGIGGDYTAVSAALNYGDADLRYTFRQGGGTTWARIASGEVRIYETSSSEAVYVGLAAPAALASSYTLTLPLALPGATALLQVSSAGVVTASNTVAEAVSLSSSLTVGTTLGVTGLITATAGVTCAANQHVTVSGTGDFKHGDRELTLSAMSYTANHAVDLVFSVTPVKVTFSGGGAYTVYMSIPLLVGDQIKSLSFSYFGDGAADITQYDVLKTTAAGVDSNLGTGSVSNPASGWASTTVNVTDTTLATGDTITFVVTINAANLYLGNVRVTYDHP